LGSEELNAGQAAEVSDTPANTNTKKYQRVMVEEVKEEDEHWYQLFPENHSAGSVGCACKTQFEKLQEEQKKGWCCGSHLTAAMSGSSPIGS
jgi:hypothetical protein